MPYIAEDVKENRLSALAQLCELLIADGLTTTQELCKRTGYGERAIRKARAELECRNSSAGNRVPNGTLVRNSSSPDKKEIPPTPPKEKTTPTTTVQPSSSVAGCAELPNPEWLIEQLTDAGRGILHPSAADLQVVSVPYGWLQAGASLAIDILPTIRAKAAKAKAANVKSWNYFTQAIADAHAARTAPLPEANATPIRAAKRTGGMAAIERLKAMYAADEAAA